MNELIKAIHKAEFYWSVSNHYSGEEFIYYAVVNGDWAFGETPEEALREAARKAGIEVE